MNESLDWGPSVDFALGQTSGPNRETISSPFFIRTGTWECGFPKAVAPLECLLDRPHRELISALLELEGHLI